MSKLEHDLDLVYDFLKEVLNFILCYVESEIMYQLYYCNLFYLQFTIKKYCVDAASAAVVMLFLSVYILASFFRLNVVVVVVVVA